jgi:hypothetical protein
VILSFRSPCVFLAVLPALAFAQPPRIFYTDLVSGPGTGGENNSGAFVTLYGERFGSTQGSVTVGNGAVAGYPVWTDTQVTIQLGPSAATGNIVLTNAAGASNGISFTLTSGNIYFVATTGSDSGNGSFATPWLTLTHARDTIAPGDIVYAMNGVAQTTDDGQGWSSCLTIGGNAGTPGAPKAMVVYPGASATIGSVNSTANGGCDTAVRTKGQGESYWVFAGFTIRGGSITVNPNNETGWRIVANDLSCPNGNDQAGCLELGYEVSLSVYGNNIHDVGTNLNPGTVTALYHGVYISEFNHGVDFGWNTIAYVQGCRGLQQNVNAGSSSYDLHIHDNVIHDTQCDGIVMTTVDPSMGTVELYNNIIYNAGIGPANLENSGAWNCMTIEGWDPTGYGPGSGTVNVYNNTLYDCGNWTNPPYGGSEGMLLWANEGNANKSMRITNNIIYASTVSPYCDDLVCSGMTGSNNIFFGNGPPPANSNITDSLNVDPKLTSLSLSSPNFHLQASSPAIEAGVTLSTLITDFDGILRPQGLPFDIGAYQYVSVGPTMTLSANPSLLVFGTVVLNQNKTLTTTITNTGNQPVTITSASIAGTGFTIVTQPAYPATLAPNGTAQYTVMFAPSVTGSATGTLTIIGSAMNSPLTVSLSGTGVRATTLVSANPSNLAFGNVVVNKSVTLTATILNTGTTNVSINAASITGTAFSIVSQPSYPVTLDPNAAVQYTIQFAPAAMGTASGMLTVTSGATNSPAAIPLSGTGVAQTAIALGKKGRNGTTNSGSGNPMIVKWSGGGSTAGSDAILVIVYGTNGPYSASNVTDSAGNIYHLDAMAPHPHTGEIYVFSCLNAAPASSVTVTPPTFGDFQIAALEYTGLLTSNALDRVGTVHDNGFQASSGRYNWTTNPSGALSQSSELVLAINAEVYGNVGGYVARGYLEELLQSTPTGSIGILEATVLSTGSVTPSGIYTQTNGAWVASFVMTYRGFAGDIAMLKAHPASLVFGNVGIDESATLVTTVTNIAPSPLIISGASVSGPGFSIVSQPSYPASLAPNSTAQYAVQLAPIESGMASGALSIVTDPADPPTTIPLSKYRHDIGH